jgi:hypothetical protein
VTTFDLNQPMISGRVRSDPELQEHLECGNVCKFVLTHCGHQQTLLGYQPTASILVDSIITLPGSTEHDPGTTSHQPS